VKFKFYALGSQRKIPQIRPASDSRKGELERFAEIILQIQKELTFKANSRVVWRVIRTFVQLSEQTFSKAMFTFGFRTA